MKKLLSFLVFAFIVKNVWSQVDTISSYRLTTTMIPMRDGVKLFTSILTPVNSKQPIPILIQRTPYGATLPPGFNPVSVPYLSGMAKEGYIFVSRIFAANIKVKARCKFISPLFMQRKKEQWMKAPIPGIRLTG